jgi:hypothetical protein
VFDDAWTEVLDKREGVEMIIQARGVDGRLYEGKLVEVPYGYRNPVSLLAEKTIRLNDEEGQEFFLVTKYIVAIQQKEEKK